MQWNEGKEGRQEKEATLPAQQATGRTEQSKPEEKER